MSRSSDVSSASARVRRLVADRASAGCLLAREVPPPYDGCELSGLSGHRWNDAYGTRALAEIPLSEAGRHFFNDRAAARDLAYFVRSKHVQQIRLSSSPRPGLEALARLYPHRVIGLRREDQFAPEDNLTRSAVASLHGARGPRGYHSQSVRGRRAGTRVGGPKSLPLPPNSVENGTAPTVGSDA